MSEDKPCEREKTLGVDSLEVGLYEPVVCSIELPEARGVAAAARILEQQGVIEVRSFLPAKVEGRSEAHSDQAGPKTVTRRLSFRKVEGKADGPDHLGKMHRGPIGLIVTVVVPGQRVPRRGIGGGSRIVVQDEVSCGIRSLSLGKGISLTFKF
jgi:hypothetical protein